MTDAPPPDDNAETDAERAARFAALGDWSDAAALYADEPQPGVAAFSFGKADGLEKTLRAFSTDTLPPSVLRPTPTKRLSWPNIGSLRVRIVRLWPVVRPLIERGLFPFVHPKASFVVAATIVRLWPDGRGRRTLPLLWGGFATFEIALAARTARRQIVREGADTRRAVEVAGARIGLSLVCQSLLALGFRLLPAWVAVVLSLPLIFVFSLLYVAARLWVQLVAMRRGGRTTDADASRLYALVRARTNVAYAAHALRARVAGRTVTDRAVRRSDVFYLGWAETYLGHVSLHASDMTDATAHYRAALAADPQNMAARALLAVVLARTGDAVGAVVALEGGRDLLRGVGRDEALWLLHVAEVSGAHEQAIALVQACGLVLVALYADPRITTDPTLHADAILRILGALPAQNMQSLADLFRSRVGRTLGALMTLANGSFGAATADIQPGTSALDLLRVALTLPAPSPRLAVYLSQHTDNAPH